MAKLKSVSFVVVSVLIIVMFSCSGREERLTENTWNLIGGEAFGKPLSFGHPSVRIIDRNGIELQDIYFKVQGDKKNVSIPAAGLILRFECLWEIRNDSVAINIDTSQPFLALRGNLDFNVDTLTGDSIDADEASVAAQKNREYHAFADAEKTYCRSFDFQIVGDTLWLNSADVKIKAVKYELPLPIEDL
ncbi:hypothetical protein [Pseudochryseolinea flava]|uniref:Uncharacterized protein n=1 Tax=Pseudochryseolinea flava TaxID=2059302 RepID=A0A364XW71_9BACT|nr:hypothetical protein [Pseudochryseolinea flava]RAV97970.1 hypothetical protein DQQ10_26225 [Pseudochryseolinea flava]